MPCRWDMLSGASLGSTSPLTKLVRRKSIPLWMELTMSASVSAARRGTMRTSCTGLVAGLGTTGVGAGPGVGVGEVLNIGGGGAGLGAGLTPGAGVLLTATGAVRRLDITISSTTSPQTSANAPAAHKIQFPSRSAICRILSPTPPISSMTTGMLLPQAGHITSGTPSGTSTPNLVPQLGQVNFWVMRCDSR